MPVLIETIGRVVALPLSTGIERADAVLELVLSAGLMPASAIAALSPPTYRRLLAWVTDGCLDSDLASLLSGALAEAVGEAIRLAA